MQASFAAGPARQQGSIYGTAIIVAMFGIFLTAALKLAPAYMDDRIIAEVMDGLLADSDSGVVSEEELRASLLQTLRINNVELDPGALELVQDAGQEYVQIDYERRVPLFFNISAVVSFRHRFDTN